MRAPFQILAIPFRITDGRILACVFHRADIDQWQFISGGGEDNETPAEAAVREISEESGISCAELIPLKSMCHIPANIFRPEHLANWPADTYVIPEYTFGFRCDGEILLSHEHTECVWMEFDAACRCLTWDSNRTALYELCCILRGQLQ